MSITKTKNDKKTIWEHIADDFRYSLSISSVSGLNQVVLNDRRIKLERLFWIMVVLVFSAIGISQGYIAYQHYKERPVIVTVDKNSREWEVEFPSITICFHELGEVWNITKYHVVSEKLNLTTPLKDEEDKYAFLAYLSNLVSTDYTNYETLESYANGSKKEYLTPDRYRDVLDLVIENWGLQTGKGRKSNKKMNPTGKGVATYRRIFTELGPCEALNPWAGLYFTREGINYTGKINNYTSISYNIVDTPAKWPMTSPLGKDRPSNNYAYIYAHYPHEIMSVNEKEYRAVLEAFWILMVEYDSHIVTISPAAQHLAVKQKNCRMPFDATERPLKHSPIYSRSLCKIECRIDIALKFCHCVPYYYRRLEGEPICNMTGLYCLSDYKDLLLNPANCECPQNCYIGTYFWKNVLQKNVFSYASVFTLQLDLPQQIYVRNLVFTPVDLTVQIGGILGLFLGSSILSMVELVYFITLRLYFGLKSRMKSNSFHNQHKHLEKSSIEL